MIKIEFNAKSIRVLTLMFTFLVAFSVLSLSSASKAFAEGIGIGDSVGTIPGAIPGESYNAAPGVVPSPGPVTIPMPGDPLDFDESWVTIWGADSRCPATPYGASLGIKEQWISEYANSDLYADPQVDLPPGSGWLRGAPTGMGGYWYFRDRPTGKFKCINPPSFAYATAECIVSTTANIREVRPSNIVLDAKTVYSGYNIGSTDRNSCYQSKSSVQLYADITRYSIVEATAVSSAVRVTFKVYTSVHPQTGAVPATEVVGIVGPYNLTPKTASLSLSCRGVSRPADYSLTDFTDNLCNPTTWNPSYQCNANPVLFDTSGANSAAPALNSFPGNSVQFVKQQTANDGKQVVFSQNPQGTGIVVNSYKTMFERSPDSTPWDSSISASKNLVELDVVKPGGAVSENILKNGTSSGWLSSKIDTTKFIAYGASDSGRPTKISQILEWTGTRQVNSARITGINPMTGEIDTVTTTINVPTSGRCTQTASIDMVRTIGDTVK